MYAIRSYYVHEEQPVDLALFVGVQHDLDRTDEFVDARLIAQMRRRRNDVAAEIKSAEDR